MPKYDVVVLGAGLGGCAVAAMLARAGKRVMLTDPAAMPGGGAASVELRGIHLPGGATCAYGFEEGGAWSTVLHDLGIEQPRDLRQASYQVVLPGRRVTVSPEVDATLEELRREYASEIDGLRRFYRDIGTLGNRLSRSRVSSFVARRRKTGGFLRSYGFSKELLAFFSAASFAFFGLSVEDLSVAQLVVLVSTPPRRIAGGVDGVAGELCEFVRRRGGECRLGEPWPELLMERSRLEGIRIAGERITFRTAVLNMPWHLREKSLYSLVREDVIPVGMLDTVLVVHDYDRPQDCMMLCVDAFDAQAQSGVGLRALKAYLPFRDGRGTASEDLARKVGGIIPFLPDFMEASVVRENEERTICIPGIDMQKQRLGAAHGAMPVRLPIGTVYVLEDAQLGFAGQGIAVQTLASRLS